MKKIGQGGPPKIAQVQTPPKTQQADTGQAKKQSSLLPQSFEPSKELLSQQGLPKAVATQAPGGTIKAGLMHRNSVQVGNLLDGARQMMDKLDQQISWRMGRLTGQFTDLFKPKSPTTLPPIRAMYGLMPMPELPGTGGPGQVKPPAVETPPIRAMYGLMPMPELPGTGGPGQVKPPAVETPPIRAMYGLMPFPGGGGTGTTPPIAAMYGVIMPGPDWNPPIQPKYGLMRPPMVQVEPSKTQTTEPNKTQGQ